MTKIWFKEKNYGYGWYPSTWQGWSVLALYLLDFALIMLRADKTSNSTNDTLIGVFIPIIIITIILLVICYLKGETPHWNWGNKKRRK